MFHIGITGQNGFVGKHLYNYLGLFPDEFEIIEFCREYFDSPTLLNEFVSKCDTIVHLAALNRHDSDQVLYDTNIKLTEVLISALEKTNSKAHIIISSSTQEELNNIYGNSKRKSREALEKWSSESEGNVTGLIIPNVFGAFGKPFYNSFIATFCDKIVRGEEPVINTDVEVKLIYIQELVEIIINSIRNKNFDSNYQVAPSQTESVSKVLEILKGFKAQYLDNGIIPVLKDNFHLQLFNTFRSFIDYKNEFPKKFKLHTDIRGTFVEIIRMGIGGQSSYSTTVPSITRGNHFHTRKIERFAVIKGKALIQLRKIDSDEILDFYLDGEEPAYVDMPIWYTHNIKNIGETELITMFWINEPYDAIDPDTYFLEV